jgi:hypothetical protein
MYKALSEKGKKKGKDVRDSKGHVHNKFHVLIIASKHPKSTPGLSEEEPNGFGK